MKTFILIFILPTLCIAQDPAVAISGKIVGRGGATVSGAIVSMEGSKLTTSSNAAGEFLLTAEESVSQKTAPYILHIDCPDRPRRTLRLAGTTASLGEIKIYKQPNFVVILTDDQRYSDLGVFGSGTAPVDAWLEKDRIPIPTPRIDGMAKEGVKFTNFYAQTYCGPSRVQLMTGSYAARVATKNNGKGKFQGLFNGTGGVDLHPSEITIAEVLRKAGYATGMIGKWHLGIDKGYKPVDQGFDYWWGARYSNDSGSFPLYENEKPLGSYDDMAHVTRDFTTRAIQWIGQHKEQPFFMWLAHTMPHKKIDASEKFKGSTERGLYGDVINEIDWYTGQLLDSLKKWKIDDNTIVVFFSDNGHWGDSENAGSSYPLRGGKMGAYEGGHRVCFVAKGPGIIPPGTVNHEIATSMDLMPTFAKLAGAAMPADRIIDGRDIEPLLRMKAGATSPHEAYFLYKTTTMRSVRQGKWKLHIRYDHENIVAAELYDLDADIGEKKDVSGANPAVVSRLMDLAKTARNDIGDFYVDGSGHRMVNVEE
jgi:arylsulfatase A-like enzyme